MAATVRIGTGAGFADDRIEPALELIECGDLDYVVFECLAERTIAQAQLEKLRDPDLGYSEWLEDRLVTVLEAASRRGTRIITNMGAANPLAAGRLVSETAAALGLTALNVAAIAGDDVMEVVAGSDLPLLERDASVASLGDRIISANAYLGIEALMPALESTANVIITGRVADPSLFLAPLAYELGWKLDDWHLLGVGTAVGHLLECGAQVTGGYFADPDIKPVAALSRVGMPIAEVCADGSFTITKTPGSGGTVSVATVVEQLLYEVHDPARYLTPDVTADFSKATIEQVAPDVISVSGVTGSPRPTSLKVSVGYRDGFIGEGQISYAGPNCVARGRLAIDIVRDRLESIGLPVESIKFDLIGIDSMRCDDRQPEGPDPAEVRVRVAGRTAELRHAQRIGLEVTALWLDGPAGGAGARRHADESVGIVSVLLPRNCVSAHTEYFTAAVEASR